ncbi:hypothetical protein Kpol_1003p52 [Vanderwaltozyma polyspora DSM 70294]|uniref:DNA/pantothenate metabolism flavoprotein C-terminal domain-containing protein n=1 Tax=Vanderwaltozyma polyspora (strain ATCC 22028 / DSM 70294 / BCRC 21397 / CBS 2163 / NBRC 10782 / NRRL Y-8283 / UCD 57-17) TaxID=436907 RepID=A7TM09_VANPO|nr:uncharacterized protein Kpol_1003p52 [Vanderwaltozyma polyspora DSM 70294]EDO16746.1 hypothetical protein Kpol_1003p52 [Vanderwaltozyma polyspora DSM 70294]
MTPPRPIIHTSTTELSTAINHKIADEIFPVAKTINDEDIYFQTNPRPPYMNDLVKDAKEFLEYQRQQGRDKIVLVTSGGTTVPLENNTVRFIDNFSAGTRGASSAEQFLANGYSVIFLHREFSLTPYNRIFTHNLNTLFLDYFHNDGSLSENFKETILRNRELYDKYLNRESRLLLLPFTTVNQYLWSLKSIAKLLDSSGCLFYLAAAVSDFFVPFSRLPKHKIQSRAYGELSNDDSENSNSATTPEGKLIINLDPVPKFLRRLVESWAKQAMIVSFKLETDESILIYKSTQALDRYNHQLVIGNLLQSRNKEVVFVTSDNREGRWIKKTDEVSSLEEVIIPEVIKAHDGWISNQEVK